MDVKANNDGDQRDATMRCELFRHRCTEVDIVAVRGRVEVVVLVGERRRG